MNRDQVKNLIAQANFLKEVAYPATKNMKYLWQARHMYNTIVLLSKGVA